jgi:hypothetical protein
VSNFITELTAIARAAGQGSYAFGCEDGGCPGWVQLIPDSDHHITIHRLWTLQPGSGNGAIMLRALCDLADRHGVELKLRPLPFGRKPYAMNRDQLLAWYERHGFQGNRRKMIRIPRPVVRA